MRYAANIIDSLLDEPDRVRVEYGSRALTGASMVSMTFGMARALRARGVGPGTITAWLVANTPEALAGRLAAHVLGAGFVGLPGFFSQDALAAFVTQARPDLLLVDPRRTAEAAVLQEAGAIPHVVGLGPVPSGVDLLAEAAEHGGEPFDFSEDADDVALIRYTSGSTGAPKGAVWPKHASYRTIGVFAETWGPLPWRHAVFHPVSDVFGGDFAFGALLGGGDVVLVEGRDEMARILATLEEVRASHVFLPPGVLGRLCAEPAAPLTDLSAVRRVVYGGQPMSQAQMAEVMALFGPCLVGNYGQSEAGAICVLTAEDHASGDPSVLASVGRPVDGVEIVFRDEDGVALPTGAVGEITVRSPTVMAGYWRNPEATAAVMRDGWLYTRDVGHQDERGYVHLTGRKRDIIFRHGLLVYAADVEAVLADHPAVAQAAVIPVPDDDGEAVWAGVVLRGDVECTAGALQELVETRLGRWHRPRDVVFLDAMPTVGDLLKPDRAALAELAARPGRPGGGA